VDWWANRGSPLVYCEFCCEELELKHPEPPFKAPQWCKVSDGSWHRTCSERYIWARKFGDIGDHGANDAHEDSDGES